MAWSRAEPLAYLTLTAFATTQVPKSHPSSFLAGATVRETPDGGVLAFLSYGLTDDEREALADHVVPGSGLPYLLPVNGWEMSAFGYSSSDNRLEQVYTPLNQDPLSNYLPTVRMSVGEYGGELSFLSWTDPQPITVAGYDGWKVTDNDGTVTAFWDAGDGNWATLRIDAKLADRADALIASVIQVTDEATNEPTAETVLPPASSESPLPAVGSQLTGNLFPVASKGPTLFVFVDPGCVPCTNAIRTLLVAEAASPTQVPQIALVVDRPSDDPGTTDWLAEIAWEGTVVDDSDGSSSALFGVDAVPYYVFVTISSDGTILDLIQGLFTSETLAELGIT